MGPKAFCHVSVSYQTILVILIFMLTTIMPIEICGFSMKLIPIDSIDSVHFPKNLTLEERYNRLVKLSKAHVSYLRSMTSSGTINSTEVPMKSGLNEIRPTVALGTRNYYITQFTIGSRAYSPYLIVDSGSHLTWVQCDRCRNCFPVRGGNFKYYESSSFQPLPCEHPLCVPKICLHNICHYVEKYLTSKAMGWVATDTFKFSGSNQTIYTFANIAFGCGFDNQNISFGPNNVIAGIFGLGAGRRSILRQLSNHTKLRYSYCLPSRNAPHGTYTFLHFGDDAKISGDLSRRVQSTSLIPGFITYFVNMLGISFERKRLDIDPRLFRPRPDHSGGFCIDSGSPHSVLVDPAYRILREEMVHYFVQRHGLRPERPGQLDRLCYSLGRGRNYTFPSITYHFEGASLILDPARIFQQLDNKFCMMIFAIREPGPNILGAIQQVDYRFLFDIEAGKVFFVSDNCRYN